MTNMGSLLRRSAAVVAVPILLGGCALPLPVKIASWAIDGISYVATQKSVTDHGISLAMEKDCALLRGVTEGQVCREGEPEIAVALAKLKERADADEAARIAEADRVGEDLPEDMVLELADFESASGPDQAEPTAAEQSVAQAPVSEAPGVEAPAPVIAEAVVARSVEETTPAADAIERRSVAVAMAEGANLFYVIGSFSSQANAQRLASRHDALAPSVMPIRIKKRHVYRVLVGPYRKDEMRDAGRRLNSAGVRHAWGIRVDPADWQAARLNPHERRQIEDDFSVAALPE